VNLDPSVFQQLFDASPNAYTLLDRELRFVAASETYSRITSVPRSELIGRSLSEVFPQDPADPNYPSACTLLASLERVLREHEPDVIALLPYRVPRPGADASVLETRYWSTTHTPLFTAHGEVAFLLQHTADVTELQDPAGRRDRDRRAVEADALVRPRSGSAEQRAPRYTDELQQWRDIFERAPGFMCVLRGEDHVFEVANEACRRLIGEREVIGLPVQEALPELRDQGFIELLDHALLSGKAFVGRGMRVMVQHAEAMVEHYLDFVYQPLVEERGGRACGVFVQGHDVTEELNAKLELRRCREQQEQQLTARTRELEHSEQERRAAEAKLRQAQKMEAVGNLTGGVAHDFNNLLQVIGGNLELLGDDLMQTARAERRLRSAREGVERGARLAAQLLAFARRQPLSPKPLDLARVLRDAADLLRRTLGKGVRVETSCEPGVWRTYADPNQLDNAILNLAINARDAMNGEGKLTLALDNTTLGASEDGQRGGEFVRLSVRDTGSGMEPAVLERAFEPFFTTKAEGAGTGLGLSMVYGFVTQSGGQVRLDSTPGRGTTVEVLLPRLRNTPMSDDGQELPPVEGGSETILVVEDDHRVRQTVVELLSELGYRLLQAPDAKSALEVLDDGPRVDLLFTDIVLPGPVRSQDLARRVQELLPDVRILFTSGYPREATGQDAKLDPALNLLNKPYGRDELARRVRALLDQQKEARSRRALRVLVVEDNREVRELVRELLTQRGHLVVSATCAEEAYQRYAEQPFAVLFSGVDLPGESGLALALRLRQRQPELRVVLANGQGVKPTSHPALQDARLLGNPYDEGAVLRAVEGGS
jgi:signal transduction histidine kinase/CheY-like chemotaxis protein/PAS domain-containing protein